MVLPINLFANDNAGGLFAPAKPRPVARTSARSQGRPSAQSDAAIQALLQTLLSNSESDNSTNFNSSAFLPGSYGSGSRAGSFSNSSQARPQAPNTMSRGFSSPASSRRNPFQSAFRAPRRGASPASVAPEASTKQSVFRAPSASENAFDTAQRRGNCGLVSFMNGLHAVKEWPFIQKLMKKFKTNDMEKVADGLGRRAGAMGDGGSTRSTWARMAKQVGIEGKAGQATLSSIAKILDTGRPVEMSLNAGVFWGMRGSARGQDHAVLAIGHEKRNGKDGLWMVDSGKPNGGPRWYSMDHMRRSLGGSNKSDVFVFKDKMKDSAKLPKSLRDKLFKKTRERGSAQPTKTNSKRFQTKKASAPKQTVANAKPPAPKQTARKVNTRTK